MVQARIDSIPDDLPNKLNLDLPVSQRAEDLVQAIIDNQVIIVAGETGSGKQHSCLSLQCWQVAALQDR